MHLREGKDEERKLVVSVACCLTCLSSYQNGFQWGSMIRRVAMRLTARVQYLACIETAEQAGLSEVSTQPSTTVHMERGGLIVHYNLQCSHSLGAYWTLVYIVKAGQR